MQQDFDGFQGSREEVEVFLDGLPVEVPAKRHSLNAIRAHLETLALAQQRVLCAISIDGCAVNLALPLAPTENFSRIEAESVALDESALILLKTALRQTGQVHECVETALTLVLINDSHVARELWWNIARQLKEPILTLSLLPDQVCGPANGGASLKQLRKWQLEQVASIVRAVDAACDTGDTIRVSDALETRVLPWLQKLNDMVQLWHETVMAGSRLGIKYGAF